MVLAIAIGIFIALAAAIWIFGGNHLFETILAQ